MIVHATSKHAKSAGRTMKNIDELEYLMIQLQQQAIAKLLQN